MRSPRSPIPPFRLILPVLATFLVSAASPAATYVVDQAKGNDANSGDASAPLQTIQAAVDKLQPGDTILIRDGIYREKVSIAALGTAAQPITIKADAGARPVLSGADQVTGWTACSSADEAGGNPEFAQIYYADIDWEPTALFENGQKREISQTPNSGWWAAPETTPLTLADAERLKNSDLVPDGATLFFFKYKGFAFVRQPIQSFDAATGTIHVEKPLGKDQFVSGTDRYRLENHVRYIDQPGEWAWNQREDGKIRVYYRPVATEIGTARIEIPRREQIVDLGNTAHCTIEGLEITQASYPGRTPDSAIGNDVNKHKEGAGDSITIRFCKIHHNGRFAIQGRGYQNLVIEKNLIHHNQYGVSLAGQTNSRVESNEIAHNLVDGLIIAWNSKDIVVRNNYIHHHSQFGHPDNVQFYRNVDNILLEGNFILASGQSVMMEQVKSATFRNNVVAGASANMMIMGHGDADNGEWERNTFALWCSSLFSLTGQNYKLKGNILANSGGRLTYGIPGRGEFSSESNLWHQAEGVKFKRLAGKAKEDGKGSVWFDSLEALQEGTGQETGSVSRDPEFKNAPAYIYNLNPHKIGDCTRDKLYYDQKGAPDINAGDVVEIHFDGVPRKVVSSEDGAITIKPALEEIPDRNLFIANWKQNTNFTLDFSSPANATYGSTIKTINYAKGDFDGDGKRDIPEY